jgi:hypothetical protein
MVHPTVEVTSLDVLASAPLRKFAKQWYTVVVHNDFHRSPKVRYLLGFLHPEGQWKRIPLSPPPVPLSSPDTWVT